MEALMSWVPLGPRFVFEPRNAYFQRLSRRNELGDQAVIISIAIESGTKPGKPKTIYAVVRPSNSLGVGLFRCTGAGTHDEDWISIADPSKPNAPLDPNCVAIDPLNSST